MQSCCIYEPMAGQTLCCLRAIALPAPQRNVAYVGRWSFSRVRPAAAFSSRSHFTALSTLACRKNSLSASPNPQKRKITIGAWNRNRALLSTMHKAPAAKITGGDPNVTINTPRDPNTLSNYHNFVTKHTVADFEIDFEKKVLSGGVELTFESLTDGEASEITLDTRYVSLSTAQQIRSLVTGVQPKEGRGD